MRFALKKLWKIASFIDYLKIESFSRFKLRFFTFRLKDDDKQKEEEQEEIEEEEVQEDQTKEPEEEEKEKDVETESDEEKKSSFQLLTPRSWFPKKITFQVAPSSAIEENEIASGPSIPRPVPNNIQDDKKLKPDIPTTTYSNPFGLMAQHLSPRRLDFEEKASNIFKKRPSLPRALLKSFTIRRKSASKSASKKGFAFFGFRARKASDASKLTENPLQAITTFFSKRGSRAPNSSSRFGLLGQSQINDTNDQLPDKPNQDSGMIPSENNEIEIEMQEASSPEFEPNSIPNPKKNEKEGGTMNLELELEEIEKECEKKEESNQLEKLKKMEEHKKDKKMKSKKKKMKKEAPKPKKTVKKRKLPRKPKKKRPLIGITDAPGVLHIFLTIYVPFYIFLKTINFFIFLPRFVVWILIKFYLVFLGFTTICFWRFFWEAWDYYTLDFFRIELIYGSTILGFVVVSLLGGIKLLAAPPVLPGMYEYSSDSRRRKNKPKDIALLASVRWIGFTGKELWEFVNEMKFGVEDDEIRLKYDLFNENQRNEQNYDLLIGDEEEEEEEENEEEENEEEENSNEQEKDVDDVNEHSESSVQDYDPFHERELILR